VTRDQRIRWGLRLLNPPAVRRDKCKRRVAMAIDFIEQEKHQLTEARDTQSKSARRASESYDRALRRAQVAFKNLTPAVKQRLQLSRMLCLELDEPRHLNFQKELDAVQVLLNWPARKQARDIRVPMAAVQLAENLCLQFGHKPTLTRRSIWPGLAAILCGDPKADLLEHCRRWRRSVQFRELNNPTA
jgi:hypothetical protein